MDEIVDHSRCPECAKKGKDTKGDNLATFENGNKYCIVCGYKEYGGTLTKKRQEVKVGKPLLINGEIETIDERKLFEKVCRKYKVKTQKDCYIFPYYDSDGQLVAQKVRMPGKKFMWRGDHSKATMFGQNLFKGGKRIVVTEGEFDAMACFQALGKNSEWPVVSIMDGADAKEGATKTVNAIRKSFDFLNSFDEVALCFDNDEPGQVSAKAAAKLFPPGKVHIVNLRYKDPNEYLMKNRSTDLYNDLWGAPKYRPDGIVSVQDLDYNIDVGDVLTYRSRTMTAKMLGRKLGTLTMVVSGTGSGKTTEIMEQVKYDLEMGVKVGAMFLEAQPRDTLLDLAGLHLCKPVRRILTQRALLQIDPDIPAEFEDNLTQEELDSTVSAIKESPLNLYDHFGSAKAEDVLANIEYMVNGLGCQAIYLDHLSLVQVAGDDMKGVEQFAKDLQSLTKRLPAHFTVISQTTKGDGKSSAETGGVVTIDNIRGSKVVAACMDDIILLSRNQQAEDPVERNTVKITSLKGRLGATTGYIESRHYNRLTGRLEMVDDGTSQLDNEVLDHEESDEGHKVIEELDD